MKNEREGRSVFYGAMIIEGIIGLIWATLGLSFYESPEALQAVISAGSPAAVVAEVSRSLLGPIGGTMAILAVIVLPITSGDTAFPLYTADRGRGVQGQAKRNFQAPVHCRALVYSRIHYLHPKLLHHLALLRICQPKLGYHGSVGRCCLPGATGQTALDSHHSGNLYDSSLLYVHHARQNRL